MGAPSSKRSCAPSIAKATTTKPLLRAQTSIPVTGGVVADKKENMSASPRPTPSLRGIKAPLRLRPSKGAPKVGDANLGGRQMKLQEICYVKGGNGGAGKKLVAKYTVVDGGDSGGGGGGGSASGGGVKCDNLVVSWTTGTGGPPEVFSEKPLLVATSSTPVVKEEASTSSASTRGRYSGYRVAKFGLGGSGGLKTAASAAHKRLKLNKPLTGGGGGGGGAGGKTKAADSKFKSRKKLRAKLI